MEKQPFFSLTKKNLPEKANEVFMILKDKEWHNRTVLAESVGLSEGQLSTVIKYMRRSSETDLEKYIAYYPISSAHGYKFCTNWEEFAPFYLTMKARAESILRTITPVMKKIHQEQIDLTNYMQDRMDADEYNRYLESLPDMGKDSWF